MSGMRILQDRHAEPVLPPEALAALQAIAEPTRARIVALLGHGEHCVCDVGDALALSTALVSHHLRVLRSAGLLRERRDGRWVFYALDIERLATLRGAVSTLLTPTDATAAACVCSDCGPRRPTMVASDRLRRLPSLAELRP